MPWTFAPAQRLPAEALAQAGLCPDNKSGVENPPRLRRARIETYNHICIVPFRDYTQSILKPVMNLEEQFNEFEYWEELGHV